MIVRTQSRRFAVVRVLSAREDDEISLCRDTEDAHEGLFLLVRFRSPELSRRLAPVLVRQQRNPAFEDYLGLFTHEGDLCARFRYSSAPLLEERLKEPLQLRERLAICGNLLERMALLNMPPLLQYEALRKENVTVDDALTVRFNYSLAQMEPCFEADMRFICLQVQELLELLFAPELAAQAVPELKAYLECLEQGGFGTYLEIYGGYNQVRRSLKDRTADDPAEPQTRLFRLWARIKSLSRFVRPVVAGLVLVAAFCYLIFTLRVPQMPKGTPVTFNNIGTVEIQSAKQP